ncbi:DUF6884 domain-containing protein [Streptomyces hokutonensis]|uniref:DUF6884 domain-containing protein n=1 Tax=Streptomyces hokutonensis TaxID=1306990 RepID=UPI00037FC23B|nr:DUF6884 domain-containing protein [Streptomyces hokutonensis]
MSPLSSTGARILDGNDNGIVSGHAAAMARLEADGLVARHGPDGGTQRMTEAGRAALDEWRQRNPDRTAQLVHSRVPTKLPVKQHEAVLTAAARPDQLVAGRDDRVYAKGEPWFNERTLAAVHRAGYADSHPAPFHREPCTWEQTGGPMYLTAAGREYARLRGNIDVHRRKVVIIACGAEKRPVPEERRNGWPAGKLYTGQYHQSLRRAADALTDQALIFVASALHGLVPLDRPLHPYDVTLGDEKAITAEKMSGHTAGLGLFDADVIFLGGRDYAALLAPSVPHLLAPLVGGMGAHRGQCRQARQDSALRDAWWKRASALHEKRLAR